MLKNLICLSAMVAVLTACGGSSSSENASVGSDTGTDVDAGSGIGSDDGSNTVLEGVWTKPCGVVDPSDPDSLFDTVALTFSGNSFTSNIKNYLDPGCSIPMSEAPNPIAEGVFSIGEEVTTSGGVVAQKLDSHITRYSGADFEDHDYTIFIIKNNALYLGDDSGFNDATALGLRPIFIDYNRIFYK